MTARSPHWLVTFQIWWLWALIFLIPFSLRYLVERPFALSTLNLLSVGFIGLGCLNVLFRTIQLKSIPHRPFLCVLAALLFAMAWALLSTSPLRNGIGLWTSRLLQPMLVGFFCYQLIVNRVLSVQSCVRALFWSLIPLFVLAGLQIFGVLPYLHEGRITASYSFPNTFARYVVLILLTSLPWFVFSKQVTHRSFHLGIWCLGILLLLSTKSYNATVSFFLGFMAMLFFLPNTFLRAKQIIFSALLILVVVVGFNAPRLPKWHTSVQDSRITRMEFWDVALGAIGDHFWTGIGIKTWEQHYPELLKKYGPMNQHLQESVQPHNVYLDSFIKAGLPGFFAIVSLLLWPLLEGRKLAHQGFLKRKENWWLGLSLIGYSVSMLAFGILDDPIWSDDVMPLLFIFLFSAAAIVVQYGARHETN